MRRSILFLMTGIFFAAVLCAAISVYVLHDVDQEMVGHWNQAFKGLCVESALFTLIIGGPLLMLLWPGRHFFHLKGYSPRATLSLWLGIGVTVFQYVWDLAARRTFPRFDQYALSTYLIFAIIVCAVVLLRDNYMQKKAFETSKESVINFD